MVQGSSCNFLVIPSWRQALFIVQSETLLKWHHSGCAPLLEAAVKGNVNASEDSSRDHGVDQRDGKEQSTLGEWNGSGANCSGRVFASTHEPSRSTCDTYALCWLLGTSVPKIGSLKKCGSQVSRGYDSNRSAMVYTSG
jgi:hypothetical protein